MSKMLVQRRLSWRSFDFKSVLQFAMAYMAEREGGRVSYGMKIYKVLADCEPETCTSCPFMWTDVHTDPIMWGCPFHEGAFSFDEESQKKFDPDDGTLENCPIVCISDNQHITHADEIRAMSDDELKEFIASLAFEENRKALWCKYNCTDWDQWNCDDCILEWLEQEAEDD